MGFAPAVRKFRVSVSFNDINRRGFHEQERFIKVDHTYSSGSDSVDRSIIPAFRAGDPGSNPGRSMLSQALMLFSFFPSLIQERFTFVYWISFIKVSKDVQLDNIVKKVNEICNSQTSL